MSQRVASIGREAGTLLKKVSLTPACKQIEGDTRREPKEVDKKHHSTTTQATLNRIQTAFQSRGFNMSDQISSKEVAAILRVLADRIIEDEPTTTLKPLIYNQSLALLTDLYQLTMAYAYWKTETHNKDAVFHLCFRTNPFKGGYAIACGLEYVIDYLQDFKFDETDLDYLSSLKGNDNQPLFEKDFLDYLSKLKFTCTIDAIPEGTIVFPNEPLIRIKGFSGV